MFEEEKEVIYEFMDLVEGYLCLYCGHTGDDKINRDLKDIVKRFKDLLGGEKVKEAEMKFKLVNEDTGDVVWATGSEISVEEAAKNYLLNVPKKVGKVVLRIERVGGMEQVFSVGKRKGGEVICVVRSESFL